MSSNLQEVLKIVLFWYAHRHTDPTPYSGVFQIDDSVIFDSIFELIQLVLFIIN